MIILPEIIVGMDFALYTLTFLKKKNKRRTLGCLKSRLSS